MIPLTIRPLVLALLASVGAATARAQVPPPPPPAAERDSLEAQVRQRMAHMLRTQLGLTDEQMRRLAVTNRRFERQRIALVTEEREVRLGLRGELESGDTARHAQVSALLERMIGLQRRRIDLLEAEQRELADFLTPFQRARYYGMEEQVRRRLMEMREQQMRRGGPDGPRRPPEGVPNRGGRRPGA